MEESNYVWCNQPPAPNHIPRPSLLHIVTLPIIEISNSQKPRTTYLAQLSVNTKLSVLRKAPYEYSS